MAPKFLFLAFDRVPGVSAAAQHLVRLIPELGQRADIDAMSVRGGELAHIQRLGSARMMRVPGGERADPESIAAFHRAAVRQLDSDNYDLVYCTDLFAAHAVASHGPAAHVPMLVQVCELPSESFAEAFAFDAHDDKARQSLKRHELAAMAHARQVLVPSEALRRHLAAEGVAAERLVVVPFGVNGELFAPPSVEIRAEPDACVVVAVIKPFRREFVAEVVETCARLPKRVRLVLAGDDVNEALVKELVAATDLGKRVRVERTATPQQLAMVLGNSDVVLCWWRWSAPVLASGIAPMLLLDAMACGRPTIAADTSGARELVGRSEATRLCRSGDLEELAGALGDLVASSALRKRLGTRGAEHVADHFGWDRYFSRALALCEAAVGGALPPLEREEVVPDSVAEPAPPAPAAKMPAPAVAAHPPAARLAQPSKPVAPVEVGAPRRVPTPAASPSPGPAQAPAPTIPPAAAKATPLVAERPAPVPPAPPRPASRPHSPTVAPSPRAAALDAGAGGAPGDLWEHDTVAMPLEAMPDSTPIPPPLAVPAPRPVASVPGLRSVSFIDEPPAESGGTETEIRPQGGQPLPISEETERLTLDEALARKLYGNLAPGTPELRTERFERPRVDLDEVTTPRPPPLVVPTDEVTTPPPPPLDRARDEDPTPPPPPLQAPAVLAPSPLPAVAAPAPKLKRGGGMVPAPIDLFDLPPPVATPLPASARDVEPPPFDGPRAPPKTSTKD